MVFPKAAVDFCASHFFRLGASSSSRQFAAASTPKPSKSKQDASKKADESKSKALTFTRIKPDDPMLVHGYGTERTAVRLDWWNNNKRWHYWATWWMLKDVNRRKLVCENAPMKMRMRAMRDNEILPLGFRDQIKEQLDKQPHNTEELSLRKLCQFTARRRGRIIRYRISRIVFRDLADHGKLSGVMRSCF